MMFPQTAVILFDRAPSLDELAAQLADADVRRRVDRAPAPPAGAPPRDDYWLGGEGTLVVPSRSGENGAVAVELFSRPWPDSFDKENQALFISWAMRYFGRGAFPYGLARAAAYADADASHAAFVRLNLSYIFGADKDAKVWPADRDVAAELRVVAALAARLIAMPSARAWFVPTGEVLLPADAARAPLQAQAAGTLTPSLWVSTRIYRAGAHVVLETLGMETFARAPDGALDHQLLVPLRAAVSRDELDPFLAELSGLHRLGRDEPPSEPVLGPIGQWHPEVAQSRAQPPRSLVRWTLAGDDTATLEVAELPVAEAERWLAHLEATLGPARSVLHELVSDVVHVDVHLFPADGARAHHVLVTAGMSARPMNAPQGAEEQRFGEVMLALPAHWPLDQMEDAESAWHWPLRLLKYVARLPHLNDSWLSIGSTIVDANPPAPFSPDTQLCGAMLTAPATLPQSSWSCQLGDDKTVFLYAVCPLHADELSFKLENGATALAKKLGARKVTEVLDPQRRSVLAKRFWLV